MGGSFLYMVPNPTPEPVHQQQQQHHKPHVVSASAATYSAPAKYGGTPTTIKPPKRLRKDDNQITRCKRRLDFAKLGLPVQRHNPVVAAKRNERERNRVRHINDTFTVLRDHLPEDYNTAVQKVNKEMSKVEILRAAIDYIQTLEQMLAGKLQISSSIDLKALIQASTSPDSKNADKHKETIAKFFGKDFQIKEEQVGSPAASVQSCGTDQSLMSPTPAQQAAMTSLAAMPEPTAGAGYQTNSDLNDNEVKCSYPTMGGMTQTPPSTHALPSQTAHFAPAQPTQSYQNDPIQHNHVTQSDQFSALQQLDSLLADNNNFDPNNSKSRGLNLVAPQHQPSWNNDMILEKNLAALSAGSQYGGQVPAMTSPALSVASSYDQQTMLDNLDLTDVDFTSLLMNI